MRQIPSMYTRKIGRHNFKAFTSVQKSIQQAQSLLKFSTKNILNHIRNSKTDVKHSDE